MKRKFHNLYVKLFLPFRKTYSITNMFSWFQVELPSEGNLHEWPLQWTEWLSCLHYDMPIRERENVHSFKSSAHQYIHFLSLKVSFPIAFVQSYQFINQCVFSFGMFYACWNELRHCMYKLYGQIKMDLYVKPRRPVFLLTHHHLDKKIRIIVTSACKIWSLLLFHTIIIILVIISIITVLIAVMSLSQSPSLQYCNIQLESYLGFVYLILLSFLFFFFIRWISNS